MKYFGESVWLNVIKIIGMRLLRWPLYIWLWRPLRIRLWCALGDAGILQQSCTHTAQLLVQILFGYGWTVTLHPHSFPYQPHECHGETAECERSYGHSHRSQEANCHLSRDRVLRPQLQNDSYKTLPVDLGWTADHRYTYSVTSAWCSLPPQLLGRAPVLWCLIIRLSK